MNSGWQWIGALRCPRGGEMRDLDQAQRLCAPSRRFGLATKALNRLCVEPRLIRGVFKVFVEGAPHCLHIEVVLVRL